MLVEEADGALLLTATHPLAEGGRWPATALLEVAAQLAGRRLPGVDGAGGMLVEVGATTFPRPWVEPGPVTGDVEVEAVLGPLTRVHVRLHDAVGLVLDTHLTLRIVAPGA